MCRNELVETQMHLVEEDQLQKKALTLLLIVEQLLSQIGQSPNPLIRTETTPGLDCQKWGGIIVEEETNHTSKEGVWAGGDVVTGAATVILAMGAGKKAAKAIDEKLSGE